MESENSTTYPHRSIFDYADIREQIEHEGKTWKSVSEILNQVIIIHEVKTGHFKENEYIELKIELENAPEVVRTSSKVLTRQLLDAEKLGLLPLRCKIIKRNDRYFTLS